MVKAPPLPAGRQVNPLPRVGLFEVITNEIN